MALLNGASLLYQLNHWGAAADGVVFSFASHAGRQASLLQRACCVGAANRPGPVLRPHWPCPPRQNWACCLVEHRSSEHGYGGETTYATSTR
jgi:hypothetical protein